MTQIEEIQKLYAKKKEYKIPKEPKKGQVQALLEITPFALDEPELANMGKGNSPEEKLENTRKFIAKALKVEVKVIEPMSIEFLKEVNEAIMDANNFNEEDAKKSGIQDFIKSKQKLIADKKRAENGIQPNREA